MSNPVDEILRKPASPFCTAAAMLSLLHRRIGSAAAPAVAAPGWRGAAVRLPSASCWAAAPPRLASQRRAVGSRHWRCLSSAASSGPSDYGVGVDGSKKWSDLNDRQRKVVEECGWSAESWDANEEHGSWYRELPSKVRSKAKTVGLDEQAWDTKKFLASPEGKSNHIGVGLILGALAVLVAAGAAVYEMMRQAEEARQRAAVWAKGTWEELTTEEQAAVATLGVGLDSPSGWAERYERCERALWGVIAGDERRLAAAAVLGMATGSWPPVDPSVEQDSLGDLADAVDAAETYSLKLLASSKAGGGPSLGLALDADGVVTVSRHGDHLLGKRLLAVGGVALGSAAERATALRSMLLSACISITMG